MSITGLLRIFFRWRRLAQAAFLGLLFVGLVIAWGKPLSYESQTILERKPMKLSPQLSSKEGDVQWDVYRLTSESQRSVALMKSRYLLERWYETLALPANTPAQKEKGMNRLRDTFSVQPVSYTDLLTIKVRGKTPAEAKDRSQALVNLFISWDLEQARAEAQQLAGLLADRLVTVKVELTQLRQKLQTQKASGSFGIGGSAVTRQIEADISAKGNLYDQLTSELEGAERQLRNDASPRTQVIAPATLSGRPVYSRKLMTFLALCLSLLLAGLLVLLLEWIDPTVHRTQDIAREAPNFSVMSIPGLREGSLTNGSSVYLGPLINAITELIAAKGPTIVQFASPSDGDGKTTISSAVAQLLASNFRVCLVHRSHSAPHGTPDVDMAAAPTEKGLTRFSIHPSEPIEKRLAKLRERYELILLDNDTIPNSPPGSSLIQQANMTCVMIHAGKTSRFAIRALRNQCQRLPDQRCIFILNHAEDPLPVWLRAH